jgi:serine phosphatase RsbU (regulator of sigma subunit)
MPLLPSPSRRPGAAAGTDPQHRGSNHSAAEPAAGPALEVWVRRLSISGWPAPAAAAACGLLLALIVAIDVSTSPDLEMAPYYLLPIILASLRFRVAGGLVVALASGALSTWPSPVALSRLDHPGIFAANAITHTLAFVFVVLVAGGLQQQSERLRQQRGALREAHGHLQQAHERVQDDLRAAAALQRHLLRRPLPETPALEVAAEIRFAYGVGGDFYDLRTTGSALAFCIADVSGKGAQAALISAALRVLLDEHGSRRVDPADFLRHLDERLTEDLPEEMFVTLFYGYLEPDSGELCYASAGHDPPLLCRSERVELLEPTGPALGIAPGLCGHTRRLTLQRGETLLLYTDGLTTARGPAGDRIGEERIAACLQEYCPAGNPRSLAELMAALLCLACPPQGAPEDDIALIALRRR